MSIELEKKIEISKSESLVLHVNEESESGPKVLDIYGDLFKLLTSTNEVDNIVKNVIKIDIDERTKDNINKVLLTLTNNNVKFLSPLKEIVKNFKEILSDNKIYSI